MRSRKPTRRSVLKAIGGTAAVASAAGVGSAETRQGMTETPSEPPFDFEYKTVGDDVRDAVGHLWWLLIVDRDRIDELLTKSPASTKETRRKQEVIDELRSTYKVELVRDEQNERELTYHLVEPTVQSLQEAKSGQATLKKASSQKEAAESAAQSVSAGLQQEAESTFEPMHGLTAHKGMAAAAVENTEYEDNKNKLQAGSLDLDREPGKCKVCSDDWMSLGDRWDIVDISPNVVERQVRNGIQAISSRASPHHMYVPGGEQFEVDESLVPALTSVPQYLPISALEVEVTGAAPRDAQTHWENATSGNNTDFKELGYAFHLLQDTSHPLHTGAIGPQVLNTQGTIHKEYRKFVGDNWDNATDTSKALVKEFKRGASSPMWDGSMEKACKVVANESSSYSDQVYETIVNNGPNNRDAWDNIVEYSAYGSMYFAGAYSRGAINQL